MCFRTLLGSALAAVVFTNFGVAPALAIAEEPSREESIFCIDEQLMEHHFSSASDVGLLATIDVTLTHSFSWLTKQSGTIDAKSPVTAIEIEERQKEAENMLFAAAQTCARIAKWTQEEAQTAAEFSVMGWGQRLLSYEFKTQSVEMKDIESAVEQLTEAQLHSLGKGDGEQAPAIDALILALKNKDVFVNEKVPRTRERLGQAALFYIAKLQLLEKFSNLIKADGVE